MTAVLGHNGCALRCSNGVNWRYFVTEREGIRLTDMSDILSLTWKPNS